MFARKVGLLAALCAAAFSADNSTWAMGFKLGQTKEQLKLEYEVTAIDHGSGSVTVNLTIADDGRLNPITSIDLLIPGQDGSGHVDLWVPLATKKVGGKQMLYVFEMRREWAERAEIQLRTMGLDGKREPLTWYYHAIPIAKYMAPRAHKKD